MNSVMTKAISSSPLRNESAPVALELVPLTYPINAGPTKPPMLPIELMTAIAIDAVDSEAIEHHVAGHLEDEIAQEEDAGDQAESLAPVSRTRVGWREFSDHWPSTHRMASES